MGHDDSGTLIIDAEGRWLEADDGLLALLGATSLDDVSRAQADPFALLRTRHATGEERYEPTTPVDGGAAVDGAFAVVAESALRRVDGGLVRVHVALTTCPDGRGVVVVGLVGRPTNDERPRIYRIGDVLARWRLLERQVTEASPASEEAADLGRDAMFLRDLYQVMFNRSADPGHSGSHAGSLRRGRVRRPPVMRADVRPDGPPSASAAPWPDRSSSSGR